MSSTRHLRKRHYEKRTGNTLSSQIISTIKNTPGCKDLITFPNISNWRMATDCIGYSLNLSHFHAALIKWINEDVMQLKYLDLGILDKKDQNLILNNFLTICKIVGLIKNKNKKHCDLTNPGLRDQFYWEEEKQIFFVKPKASWHLWTRTKKGGPLSKFDGILLCTWHGPELGLFVNFSTGWEERAAFICHTVLVSGWPDKTYGVEIFLKKLLIKVICGKILKKNVAHRQATNEKDF